MDSQTLDAPFIGLLFAALYAYGMWCGAALIGQRPGWLRMNKRFWLLQVPGVTTGIVGYWFASGLMVAPFVRWEPLRVGLSAGVGSYFEFNFLKPAPIVVGVNVAALFIWAYLHWLGRDKA
jgi:hypothetical protein